MIYVLVLAEKALNILVVLNDCDYRLNKADLETDICHGVSNP